MIDYGKIFLLGAERGTMASASVDRVVTGSTRRGTAFRAIREQYLRDDVSCGLSQCPLGCAATGLLSTTAPIVVIPATAALDDYADLWELPDIRGLVFLLSWLRWVHFGLGVASKTH